MKIKFESPQKEREVKIQHYECGETKFLMIEENGAPVAILTDPMDMHLYLIGRHYNYPGPRGIQCATSIELEKFGKKHGATFIGGGYLDRHYDMWSSNGCKKVFKRYRPENPTDAARLLKELREEFDKWLASNSA